LAICPPDRPEPTEEVESAERQELISAVQRPPEAERTSSGSAGLEGAEPLNLRQTGIELLLPQA
jgi:hypothetical protein